MENIYFELPIYVDVVEVVKNGLNIKNSVIDQLNQGDPAMDTILEGLEEKFGWNDCYDTANFEPYITADKDSIHVDGDETYCLDTPGSVALDVSCQFDTERFSKDFGLEENLERD